MFKFLFRRSAKKDTDSSPQTAKPAAAVVDAQQAKQAEAQRRKQAALSRLEALHEETMLADFVLECEFADLRLKAAEKLHAKEPLEKVLHAMRNSDRRVAKLMQLRLKEIEQRIVQRRQAESCIEQAKRLLNELTPSASKIVELDRSWSAAAVSDENLLTTFAAIRHALAERLRSQGELQRTFNHLLAELKETKVQAHQLTAAELACRLEGLSDRFSTCTASPEAHALPKPLLDLWTREYELSRAALAAVQKRQAALDEREAMLVDWENTNPADLQAEALKKAWRATAPLDDEMPASLQTRFDALLQKLTPVRPVKAPSVEIPVSDQDVKKALAETLDGLEKAVEDGLLLEASRCDKLLRSIDFNQARPSEAQTARLVHARQELQRLKDWARWGGNVSREELVKAVEELPSQALPVAELAKKVGSSRERWKSLDATAGPAPKILWERFDSACTAAYAPVAEHYRKLAEERQANLAEANALLAEIVEFRLAQLPDDVDPEAEPGRVDWKGLAAFCRRVESAWKRVGPIDRKDKKRLDQEFDGALRRLAEPLRRQRELEAARRTQLIADIAALDTNDRNAFDTLKALQARWQEQAKAVPLEHRDEQALWQRFREASDAFFTRRKAFAEAADSERQQHLAQKEALCAELEAAVGESEPAVQKRLRDAASAWNSIGSVPRAVEKQVEQRYQNAVAALKARLDESKRASLTAQTHALRDKVRLCLEVETAATVDKPFDETWQTRWQALPALSPDDERQMASRFEAALLAVRQGDRQYSAVLHANRPALLEGLLRKEIVAGLDSPPEQAAERLKLQVEVLQSSMKSGLKPAAQRAQVVALCALPAAMDEATIQRLERLLQRVA